MIHLMGYIDIPEDRYEAVMAALPEHVKLTRAEPGNLTFHAEVSKTVPFRLEVDETFIDDDAFKHHQERTAASPWAEVTRDIPRNFTIEEQQ